MSTATATVDATDNAANKAWIYKKIDSGEPETLKKHYRLTESGKLLLKRVFLKCFRLTNTIFSIKDHYKVRRF